MIKYYVNKLPENDGGHEVHAATCANLPRAESRGYLGNFSSYLSAVTVAKKVYPSATGCSRCCVAEALQAKA